jgi:hypothetical protein
MSDQELIEKWESMHAAAISVLLKAGETQSVLSGAGEFHITAQLFKLLMKKYNLSEPTRIVWGESPHAHLVINDIEYVAVFSD